ncbi:MAG TPA: isoprenylcysteine carboxylmethyltransferase family protein [Arenicellales bacterium]|nr:isoprenylcysteine carboxylmethyltransferase family protein [Arenicellales bacterium]
MASISELVGSDVHRRAKPWLVLGVALVLAAALLPRVDPHWYWPGLIVSLSGMLARLWVLGSVRSRKLLPVNGPYRFVRNPGYIADFVFIFGLVLMAGDPTVFLFYIPIYVVYTLYRVSRDEEALDERFGAEYRRYCKEVPRFLPRLKPRGNGRTWYFNLKQFQRQYGEIFLVLSALLYAACYVAAFHLD